MEALKKFINSKIQINADNLETIISNFKELKIEKDKFALKQGHIATNFFFVKSGGLRVYVNHNDQEITSWVALENEFFTDLSSQKARVPSKFNMQAIEDTILMTIKAEQMEQLYRDFPIWQEFGRLIWEANFIHLVEGIITFQTLSAEERYLFMMKESNLLQRVPLKQLASYLGITQTSLSRLRKKIK